MPTVDQFLDAPIKQSADDFLDADMTPPTESVRLSQATSVPNLTPISVPFDATRVPEVPPRFAVAGGGQGVGLLDVEIDPRAAQSMIGISPEKAPTAAALMKAGAPAALAYPVSLTTRTAAGLAGYTTSPRGVVEAGTAVIAAPVVLAKWAYDMVKGGYESGKDLTQRLVAKMNDALNRQIITHNDLGIPPTASKEESDEFKQAIAEDALNIVASPLMAAGMGRGAVRGITSRFQTEPPTIQPAGETYASRVVIPEEIPQLEVRPQMGQEAPLRQQGEVAGAREQELGRGPQAEVLPQPEPQALTGQIEDVIVPSQQNEPARTPSEGTSELLSSRSIQQPPRGETSPEELEKIRISESVAKIQDAVELRNKVYRENRKLDQYRHGPRSGSPAVQRLIAQSIFRIEAYKNRLNELKGEQTPAELLQPEEQAAVQAELARTQEEAPQPIEVVGKVKGMSPDEVSKAVTGAVYEGGAIKGLKTTGEKTGHYVVVPPEKGVPGDEPMAVGPFESKPAAQDFLDAEVGAPRAKVVEVLPKSQHLPEPTARDYYDRNKFIGEDYAGPPNSIVVQLRGLDSEPIGNARPIALPFDGSLENAGKAIWEKVAPIIRNRNASWRESIIKITDGNGKLV